MEWDSWSVTFWLSPDSQREVLLKVRCTVIAWNISQWVWESLLGSLNYTAEVLLLGWIRHCHLSYEGNHLFHIDEQDWLAPLPAFLHPMMWWWLDLQHLASSVPWTLAPPWIFVEMDASKEGLGFQASLEL